MNLAMATLGLNEMGKFLWEGREKSLPSSGSNLLLLIKSYDSVQLNILMFIRCVINGNASKCYDGLKIINILSDNVSKKE